jgi:hypothetical protein
VLIPERLWEWYRTPDLEHLGRPAYVDLGGHPKPAINGQLKTGHCE